MSVTMLHRMSILILTLSTLLHVTMIDTLPISQDRLDVDRLATEQDVMEATDKIPPLLLKYCPDGTHCIATWNVNNCFHAESIVKVMLRCNISILVIQKPQHKPTTEKMLNLSIKPYRSLVLRDFFLTFSTSSTMRQH